MRDAILLRFLLNNPDQRSWKRRSMRLEELWMEITVELNSYGLPSKCWLNRPRTKSIDCFYDQIIIPNMQKIINKFL